MKENKPFKYSTALLIFIFLLSITSNAQMDSHQKDQLKVALENYNLCLVDEDLDAVHYLPTSVETSLSSVESSDYSIVYYGRMYQSCVVQRHERREYKDPNSGYTKVKYKAVGSKLKRSGYIDIRIQYSKSGQNLTHVFAIDDQGEDSYQIFPPYGF